jgi:hypothetical protein
MHQSMITSISSQYINSHHINSHHLNSHINSHITPRSTTFMAGCVPMISAGISICLLMRFKYRYTWRAEHFTKLGVYLMIMGMIANTCHGIELIIKGFADDLPEMDVIFFMLHGILFVLCITMFTVIPRVLL